MDAAVLGDRLLEVTQKPFLGPGSLQCRHWELESACKVSILWDAVTVPTVCFSWGSSGVAGQGQQQFASQALRVHLLGLDLWALFLQLSGVREITFYCSSYISCPLSNNTVAGDHCLQEHFQAFCTTTVAGINRSRLPKSGKLNLRTGTGWRAFFQKFVGPPGPYDFLEKTSETPVCSSFCLFAMFGEFVRNFGWVFVILFDVLLVEIQEEIPDFAGWEGGGLEGTKIVNKHFVNKQIRPSLRWRN